MDRKKFILEERLQLHEKILTTLFERNEKITIFDIGACEGESSIRYARLFKNSRIVACEPVPKNVAHIESNIEKYGCGNISPIQTAISDSEGTGTLFVSHGAPPKESTHLDWDFGNKSSSLFEPLVTRELTPWLAFDESLQVKKTTLHSLCLELGIETIEFVHLDVQGSELQVLQGAKKKLAAIQAIWVEVVTVELYKGQSLREDLERFFINEGFIKLADTCAVHVGDQFWCRKELVEQRLSLRSRMSFKLSAFITRVWDRLFWGLEKIKPAIHTIQSSAEVRWIAASTIVSAVCSAIGLIFLSHQLTPPSYGEFSLSLTGIGLLGLLIFGPLGAAALRYSGVARNEKNLSGLVAAFISLSLRASLLVLLLTILAALTSIASRDDLFLLVVLTASIGLASGITSIAQQALISLRKQVSVAKFQITNALLSSALPVLMIAVVGASASSALLGLLISTGVILVIHIQRLFSLQEINDSHGQDGTTAEAGSLEHWRSGILRYAAPFVYLGFFHALMLSSERIGLGLLADTSSVGIFSIAYQLGFLPMVLLCNVFEQIANPVMFEKAGSGDDPRRVRLASLLCSNISIGFGVIVLFATVLGSLFSDAIFRLFVGAGFQQGSDFFPFMVLSGGLFSLGQLLASSAMIHARPSLLKMPKALVCAATVLLNLTLIQRMGLLGAVYASLLSSGLFFFCMLILHLSLSRKISLSR